jgi:Putative lumazine-binding
MKKTFLFLGLCLNLFTLNAQTTSTPSDWQLVEKTIQRYFEGVATGDSVMMGQTFHPSWQLKVFNDKGFAEIPKSEYLVGYKKHEKSPNFSARIVSLDITNNIGSAKVEINTSKLLFTDYFNLIKTDEGWFIVDKISTRTPHKTVVEPAPTPKN